MKNKHKTYQCISVSATEHHRPLAGTKLYCSVMETCACVNNLPRTFHSTEIIACQVCDLLVDVLTS